MERKELKWECTTRMNFLEDEAMLELMNESGCTQISLGIETLSKIELNEIGKKYDVDSLEETIKRVQKYNIKIKACIMLGIPHQNKESILNTFTFLENLNVEIRPTIYTPYQTMDENMIVDQIESYNRKLFHSSVDGVNDYELLLNADIGICMEHSCQELKNVSDFVTRGFSFAIEKLIKNDNYVKFV